ncbi:Wzz/FepE/Etk N-terminal domain-containing protein, partial [Photobacterium sanguinicancri]
MSIQKKEMITDEHLEVRPNNQQDSAEQFDLFNILWGAKIKIISITAIFIVAAVLYAVTAQKWWSTQAIVIPAQLNDYSEYRNQVKQYQAIFDVYQQDGTVLINKELNQLIKSENIFEHF